VSKGTNLDVCVFRRITHFLPYYIVTSSYHITMRAVKNKLYKYKKLINKNKALK
jgi:hypothetical protein